ncbi:MAG TPA: recombinase family protein [Candidatus Baltobacteraceae bacterium]|nr:recombinase family protein [Candidatus Baltobacteraceae bacterium]
MRGRKAKTAAPATRKIVGYVRVSTEDQAREGVSLASQRARIAAYCEAMQLDLAEIVEDAGISAKSLHRPGMQRIMQGVRIGEIGAVVALKLDRLTRSTRDFADLLDTFSKADAALISMTESLDTKSAGGRLVANIMANVAQWEREAIGERTRDALAHMRQERKAYGRTPFGYRRVGNELVEDRKQQTALREAQCMHKSGASYRQIASKLMEMRVKPNGGAKEWHAASVRAMLSSKMALG